MATMSSEKLAMPTSNLLQTSWSPMNKVAADSDKPTFS